MSEQAGGTTPVARSGARLLLELLRSEGVEYVFGNPGTTELPLIDALSDTPDIHYVWGLQEASVVAMADGYAQASGKPGFVNLHTASGVGHGFGNMLNAAATSTPLVVTAGQQDLRHALTDPLLLADLKAVAAPACKWVEEVTDPDRLPVLVRRAFQDAAAPPGGTTFLSLPMDVMERKTDVSIPSRSRIDRRPQAGSLALLAEHLSHFDVGRVAIIAGDEVAFDGAFDETVALAEALGAPVFGASWPARLAFPTAHECWCGTLATSAQDIADTLAPFDAVFALGGKSFIAILYTEGSAMPESKALYQLSGDGRDLGRTYPTELSVVGDLRSSLCALLGHLKPLLVDRSGDVARTLATARDRHDEKREQRLALVRGLSGHEPVHPMVAAYEIASALPHDVPVVDEAIATASHLRAFIDVHEPHKYAFNRGGGLGWGMPAAVGYSLGLGRRPVVCTVGDGAALYSPQAMWTAAHEKLPIVFVIINNREYSVLKGFMRSQDHYVANRTGNYLAMDLRDPPIDFEGLARAMGVPYTGVRTADAIGPALDDAIVRGGPAVLDIAIASELE